MIVVDNRWVKADIESGAVKKGTKVSLTCTKQGGTIYYTTDGSEPSKNSTQYTYPIEINSDMILKAKAYVGNEESKTSQWKYVVSSHLDGEIFRANNNEGVEIKYKVRTNSSGSVYCIVTGGSSSLRAIDKNYSGDLIIPTYAEDIVVTGIDESAFEDCKLTSVTLPKYEGLGRKFTIYKNAFKYSNIRTFTVPISNRVSIGEEAFSKCYNLETINFNHTGIEKISTKAFYDSKYIKTINSNLANPPKLPTDCFDEKVYNNAILYIPQGKYDTYKYSDWKKFKNIFEQGTQQQQIKLTASPSGGEVDKGTTVYLSTDVSDADIYYTLDGTTPSKSSYYYTAAIIINESCTLKAIAYKDGFKDSDVITEYYTVDNGSDPGDDPGDDPGNDPGPDPGKDPDTIPEGSIVIDDTNFPDVNFRKALLNMEEGADGYLTKEDIESLTYVEIVDYGVSDFKGIEFLTSLISFDCSYNNISSIDLSKSSKTL